MKKICESLKECEIEIINFRKKKMKLLTNDKHTDDKKYRKVRGYCHYTGKFICAAHSICNLKYSVPKNFL